MIYNIPAIGAVIKQKVRKKKRTVLMLILVHSVKNHGTKITYISILHGEFF